MDVSIDLWQHPWALKEHFHEHVFEKAKPKRHTLTDENLKIMGEFLLKLTK